MQFTAMATLNKVIDAAIVHRIGDLPVDTEAHLQPPAEDRLVNQAFIWHFSASEALSNRLLLEFRLMNPIFL